ncbi:MAG: lysostaphin resistance A-like protein [Mycetocola reblochoni]|uniref:CAAX prenyl protease 2/Lysostaphin resistance protein A-like domain-containing protein n=2 Tax=Mycetocola reblochoni TaxID=331618 RepID=A0A1R4IIB8_9MICO|nr:CPBP family intramembrane glutamic endopeptidase [Mycetocola reblochoni]RLP69659.1 CPBP family intramembrane metalloprotease [Mycetocola reblochoni]SJN19566.1 hypothetical protein FM119_01950 [Mycetocola reblochoni REB411]
MTATNDPRPDDRAAEVPLPPDRPVPTAAALEPRRYHHALRPVVGWWRGVLGILTVVLTVLILGVVFSIPAMLIDIAVGWTTVDDLASGTLVFTPTLMLANNLSLAALIPVSMLMQWALYGVRPRWLSSVEGGFRWRWFWRLALIIAPVMAIYVAISVLTSPLDDVTLDAFTIGMLLVVVLTTPLQSAGEEYGARGLVQRSVSGWFASARIAFVVSSLVSAALFMVAHGATDMWLNAYYLCFAFAMGWAAWASGGLEAPVLIHICNNLFLLIPTALMGQTDGVFDRGAGVGGVEMLIPMAVMILVAGIAVWLARRRRPAVVGVAPTRYRTR